MHRKTGARGRRAHTRRNMQKMQHKTQHADWHRTTDVVSGAVPYVPKEGRWANTEVADNM
eukprot:4506125-Alexandrium_andersonii.AAC.1